MGNHHDSIALDWVRGEIQDTLTQGQHALEAYVENRDDKARLRFCLNQLHQVHGTLQMVELYGAALLSEEMEKLTLALLDDSVASEDEAVSVLMEAILQLPQYLEHLVSSQDDFPMVLLPLLNDLRAARGDTLLSDTSLFKPDLAPSRIPVDSNASRRLQDPKVLSHVRKLRQMYQFALAGIIREENLDTQFTYLQKVIHRLVRLSQNTSRGELWKTAAAFVETLQAGANPVNAAVKSLLRELDGEIRRLIEEHGDILEQPAPEALLKHLLYYVARARGLDSEKLRDLRTRYQLEGALPSDADVDAVRNRVSGPGREAIQSVVSALNEELAKLKDQLDLFVRSDLRQNSELESLIPGMVQLGNTLAVLGLGVPRKVITEQVGLIEKLSAQNDLIDDATLMGIAGALLYVEASLADLENNPPSEKTESNRDSLPLNQGSRELGEANKALLRESRYTLEQVKSAVINFIASQWDRREIEHVPGLLHSIQGGLKLIPLERVASMLASAEHYTADVLLSHQHVPDWKQLDTFADAITSIEYYLERLAEGISDNEGILRIAESSLARLGFPAGEEPTLWTEPADDSVPVIEPMSTEEPAPDPSNAELVDDEILGIFAEEAEEVLQTIHEFYPRLRQDHNDRDSLTEVRRAFHTLKGSGRLVGATSIAELAWSVENLLNRVLDQSVKVNDDLLALLDEVIDRIPSLIHEFRDGHTAGDVAQLIERAEAMATTRRSQHEPAPVMDAPAATPPEATADSEQPDDLIDDEILEIFVEEAGEVLDTIREYLPMLLRQHDDRSALSEVRRAFHTLKGSGRMVGAQVVGELAWSVENLLNRVLDGSIFINDDIVGLLEESAGVLPALVHDFESQQAPSIDVSELETRAHALAKGAMPGTGPMPPAESDGPSEPVHPELSDVEFDAKDDGVDQVLLDIFENEADTHLQTIRAFLAHAEDKASVPYTDDLSRALHTLKGSAHTAGIAPVAAIIAPLERFIKDSRAQNLRADQEVLSLIETACSFLSQGLAQIRQEPQAPLPGTEAFLDKLEFLTRDRLHTYSTSTDSKGQQPAPPQLVRFFQSEGLDVILEADLMLAQWARSPQQPPPLQHLITALATLTHAAADAGLANVAALSEALQEAIAAASASPEKADDRYFAVLGKAHEHLINMMDEVAAGLTTESADALIAEVEALTQSHTPQADPELTGIFLEEAYDLINSTGSALHLWSETPSDRSIAAGLQRDVHTLKGGARMAGADAIADLTHVLEDLFEKVAQGQLTAGPEMNDLLFACHDRLAQMVEQVATQKPCPSADDLIARVESVLSGDATPEVTEPEEDYDSLTRLFLDEGREIHAAIAECLHQWRDDPQAMEGVSQLQQELHTLKGGARLADADPIASLAEAWTEALDALLADPRNQKLLLTLSRRGLDNLQTMLNEQEQGEEPVVDTELLASLHNASAPGTDSQMPASAAPAQSEPEAIDQEILEIFLEEAGDIMDQLEQLLADWRKDPASTHFNQEAQRTLHTLKGGARLTQLTELGDKAHALETRLTDLDNQAPDEQQWQAITEAHDQIIALVADAHKLCEPASAEPEPADEALPAAEQPSQAGPTAPAPPARAKARNRTAQMQRSAQETLRVSAPLLDELVNLAGETSITRGRLEQQSSDFSNTLDEMAVTIERLREQLRRMDIETEAQILFRAEKEHGPDYGDDFDPLEMDRYSSIQQLSRALTESSSDLADLRETLSDRVRDTETLLVQQSRINTELQEGLMKTRMIPFTSMVPRLRRIVRQISSELGKHVEFDVRNAEGEMDRSILERMIAPLEHMLRNAIDHGIEPPADRRASGKAESGKVTLSLAREGGDIVLRMTDDGAGIASSEIRDKAVQQGLMGEDEELSEREILQFIVHPGFSTARQVTQVSGRGVGMDVVASEIKQLGGSLNIDSKTGQGTVFTVRLPFTVSVNRALMVSTGEDFYAIPLDTIEGIVRVSTYELEEYYKPGAPMYEYAGQEYRLQYLGSLLNSDYHPKLQGQALPLPVILVRGAEQPMALQVDHLMGSREIVVKSLGPQFSTVRGVSGATILGDGNVVVILDLPALIRSDILSERQRLADLEKARESARRDTQAPLVMVVDDSVTVRKVTSRLLERNGMEVLTAKDGLDAVAQLQDHKPDIMLLDIEMPRMDGFEVAGFVRHDDNLHEMPICMITSRTGEKHRERALAVGVNEYLGKPFQETELLTTIERLTGKQL
ncbi:Hpt domain-containing protein [Marinobacter piscensis]|uniref:Hpt domain-containing protein n=1 Tax=Marinobacter piscensis TaxID=1562308 RepID=UPI0011A36750|nr:Hpt domain-containing protein [Marinobacter piscensis]